MQRILSLPEDRLPRQTMADMTRKTGWSKWHETVEKYLVESGIQMNLLGVMGSGNLKKAIRNKGSTVRVERGCPEHLTPPEDRKGVEWERMGEMRGDRQRRKVWLGDTREIVGFGDSRTCPACGYKVSCIFTHIGYHCKGNNSQVLSRTPPGRMQS